MTSIEESIPAFSMWKIFYDTMNLLKQDHSESAIEHLVNIVNSEKLTSILLYTPADVSCSYEQCNIMEQKYKAFTVWLLGKFFHFSSFNNLAGIHKLVTDVQLRILHLISTVQPHIYHELTKEYTNILNLLNNYKTGEKIQLNIFEVEHFEDLQEKMDLRSVTIEIDSYETCGKLKKTILIFMHHIIMENLKSCRTNDDLLNSLENVIYVLKEDSVELKLDVLEIYKSVMRSGIIQISNYPVTLQKKLDTMIGCLETLIYEIYNLKLKVTVEILDKLENLLIIVLRNKNSCKNFKIRISKFMLDKLYSTKELEIGEDLQKECCEIFVTKKLDFGTKVNLINQINIKNMTVTLELLFNNVFIDLKNSDIEEVNYQLKPVTMVESLSPIWYSISMKVKEKLQEFNCGNECVLSKTLMLVHRLTNMILKFKMKIMKLFKHRKLYNMELFHEEEFLVSLISFVNKHVENCKSNFPLDHFTQILINMAAFTNTANAELMFHLIAYPFMTVLYKTNNELPVKLYGNCDKLEGKTNLKFMYKHLALFQDKKETAMKNICDYICLLQSGLANDVNATNQHNLEVNFTKIFADVFVKGSKQVQSIFAKYIPHIVNYLKDLEFIPRLLLHLTNKPEISLHVMKALPQLICILCSNNYKTTVWRSIEKPLEIVFDCIFCLAKDKDGTTLEELMVKRNYDSVSLTDTVQTEKHNIKYITDSFKTIWKFYQNQSNPLVVRESIHLIESLSKHIESFHSIEMAKEWIKLAGHDDRNVRLDFSKAICDILKSSQEIESISRDTKEIILNICLEEIFKLSKNSLQYANFELQDTLLETLDAITNLKIKIITLEVMKILMYFIMIPTSKYSETAEYFFLEVAKKHSTKPLLLYGRYRRELCKCIVDLCAINQALIQYTMNKSLENISLVLGYVSVRDFVSKDNNYLMPYLVSLIVVMPNVLKLISELAELSDTDESELLANNYGNIFLYIFLNKTEKEFKECMKYIEGKTGLSASVLRKSNFRIILNELLLNFHEKRDRVLVALKLLAAEDTNGEIMNTKNIPDYLQPRFLGVLQYFDTKLLTNKQVLLSLVEIFKFMGPKRIAPFRFKIIALLRTALNLNYGTYPELNCNVWEAFVKNCDIESLGGQLAMVFVSLLPLNDVYPAKINEIFSYLILKNEKLLKDSIADLFFVLHYNVEPKIQFTIRKHLEQFEKKSFRDKLKNFLKYITHETNEVKIHALKYLKTMIEKNRSELDQMVLGYNGMDSLLVELIEILTSGCMDKDKALKLACGDCIGELGGIEPSHLPRKYTEAQSFAFFITDDAFIISSLNELIRALQAEKNTTIMDRFALAIQETLKTYSISSQPNSPKHTIWNSFTQFQKELIIPLLSSRYTMGQTLEPVNVSPIYGSDVGDSFQAWSHNWVCYLITTITTDKRSLLEVYLPSMKQNHRTFMHFIPHILLHTLLEGKQSVLEKCYDEFMAILNSYNNNKTMVNMLYTKPLRASRLNLDEEDGKQHQCTKVLFVLLDFLERWTREWEWERGAAGREDKNYKTISYFVSKFCKLQLAKCSFICGEYSRTLLYLEDYIVKKPEELDNQLFFLAKIYAQLDESDAVAGVTTLQQKEPILEQRILSLEVSGKLSDAVACYERIKPPLKLHHLQGLLQCYLDLDHVNTTLYFTCSAVDQQPEYASYLLEMQAEPLWRLGKYDDLEKLLEKPEIVDNSSWGVNIGKALLQIQKEERDQFKDTLNVLRTQQVDILGATSLEEGAYQHGYESVVKLHALNELELVEKVIQELLIKANDHKAAEMTIKNLSSEWELRIKVVQESIKIIEPILCLRRVALNHAKSIIRERVPTALPSINSLLGELWLLSAKIARRASIHQQAYMYTLKAEEYAPPKLFLERAKLHWLREEHEQALTTLKRGIEKLKPNLAKDIGSEQQKICAEAKLLIATYNDNISNVDTEAKIMYYKEALEMSKEWEKSYVSLAQYYDRIFQTYSEEDRDSKGSDIQIHMINFFGKSMLYGSNYVYQSMPRMLSIWFDYGTRLLDVSSVFIKEERQHNLLRMTKLIDTFLERLPSYIFLTAFSQIVSRICHPQKEVYIELKSIIIKLIQQYPQQTMWMIISVIKSGYSMRSKRCAEILGDCRLRNPAMVKLVTDFTKLAEKLIELCNRDIPENVNVASINTLLRTLPRLITKDNFSEIMIPTQKFRKLVLPNPDFKSSQHNPFPNHYVHIIGIEDEIVILQSLQRPRKITFKGSDGKGYIQMLKPKDDLRKDFRLMEFNDIVNQMLSRDPDSRQRRLNIRLYSVAPLNEECGLIEWLPKLVGLRPVVMSLYKQKGQAMKARELKDSSCNLRDPLAKKRDIFEKKLLPKHPPILGEWFKKTFPDVQSWLMARIAYTRTTAVISMVGYILGLGDRHGENILLDSLSGDTVHVDFNCLFNKGETFEWPERVPFRLTHNMVSAMGPLGVEGVFRKSSACTLKALREHTNTLMSIVTPFVYDPLVSWHKGASTSMNAQNAERTNEQAVEHVRNIKLRLQGMTRTRGRSSFSIALSVDGQINNIIEEAMSVDNLCQMYIGWGAYL